MKGTEAMSGKYQRKVRPMRSELYWAVKSDWDRWVYYFSIARTRKDAIKQFMGLPGTYTKEWADYQASGYRVVRVKVGPP